MRRWDTSLLHPPLAPFERFTCGLTSQHPGSCTQLPSRQSATSLLVCLMSFKSAHTTRRKHKFPAERFGVGGRSSSPNPYMQMSHSRRMRANRTFCQLLAGHMELGVVVDQCASASCPKPRRGAHIGSRDALREIHECSLTSLYRSASQCTRPRDLLKSTCFRAAS